MTVFMSGFKHDIKTVQKNIVRQHHNAYKDAIRDLYTRCLHATKNGQRELVHIYDRVPVEQHGLKSIRLIRKYITEKLGLRCRAIKLYNREIGVVVYLG